MWRAKAVDNLGEDGQGGARGRLRRAVSDPSPPPQPSPLLYLFSPYPPQSRSPLPSSSLLKTPLPGVCIGWARPVKKISDLKKCLNSAMANY